LAAWVRALTAQRRGLPQRTDHLHPAVTGLGLSGGGAGLDRPSRRVRVEVVGLAVAPAGGTVGPVHPG
jgi:hypothetical protein